MIKYLLDKLRAKPKHVTTIEISREQVVSCLSLNGVYYLNLSRNDLLLDINGSTYLVKSVVSGRLNRLSKPVLEDGIVVYTENPVNIKTPNGLVVKVIVEKDLFRCISSQTANIYTVQEARTTASDYTIMVRSLLKK